MVFYRRFAGTRGWGGWDINPGKPKRLADQLTRDGFKACLTDDLETAARTADIVTCATLSRRLRQIGVFHAIMATGAFSEAGQMLFGTQPAVSRILAAAEYRLKFPIFERTKGRLIPTPEALRLFSEAQLINNGFNQFNAQAAGLPLESQLLISCEPDTPSGRRQRRWLWCGRVSVWLDLLAIARGGTLSSYCAPPTRCFRTRSIWYERQKTRCQSRPAAFWPR